MIYPMTPTQQRTARRRGWTCSPDGKWKQPKNFSDADRQRIRDAEIKRELRGQKNSGPN